MPPGWPISCGLMSRFRKACRKHPPALHFHEWPAAEMAPAAGPAGLMAGAGDHLARRAGPVFSSWSRAELDWFADCQARERFAAVEALRHYRYRWVAKPSGSLRLIEAPKPRLKQLQRRVLDEILLHIPPHEAAHGFRPGRSVTFVRRRLTSAERSCSRWTSATSSCRSRAAGDGHLPDGRLSRAGCPAVDGPVHQHGAAVRSGTRRADSELDPSRSAAGWQARRLYRQPHLPQGAPTSPALANLAATGSMRGWPASHRAAEASYTRYADDLVFSGGESFARSIARFPDARRGDRTRGGLRRPAPQDAGHAAGRPATCGRGRDQSEDQYHQG